MPPLNAAVEILPGPHLPSSETHSSSPHSNFPLALLLPSSPLPHSPSPGQSLQGRGLAPGASDRLQATARGARWRPGDARSAGHDVSRGPSRQLTVTARAHRLTGGQGARSPPWRPEGQGPQALWRLKCTPGGLGWHQPSSQLRLHPWGALGKVPWGHPAAHRRRTASCPWG